MKGIKSLKPKYETFEAVYTSGLTIDDSLLTALCLIFDKIHILNNLEFAIEFSKKYTFEYISDKILEWAKDIEITPISEGCDEPNPLSILNEEQAFTAKCYLSTVFSFGLHYNTLFDAGVINCSLFEDNQPIKVKLVRKGKPGELNTYAVSPNPQIVTTHGIEELNQMVENGKVPILGYPHVQLGNVETESEKFTAPQFASILALRSLNLVLPQTKPVDSETILGSTGKTQRPYITFLVFNALSYRCYRSLLDQNISTSDIERECEFIIDTHVRPKLIDLNQKIIKERKGWFGKIITHAADGVKIFAAKPPLTTTDLLTTAVAAGANITLAIISESMKLGTSTKQSGLTLLIELDKYLRNRKSG